MSFLDGPAPDYCEDLLAKIHARHPTVFLIIKRSKNQNIVVYEANIVNGVFDKDRPISVYWCDIDPAYRAKTRARGINHDRVELTSFEQSVVYGVTVSKRLSDKEVQFDFNAEAHPCRVKYDGKSAKLFTLWEGTPYYVRSAYVAANDVLPNLTNLRANVRELSFNGVNLTTKQPTTIILVKN